MTTTTQPVDNGVNVDALLGARAALNDAPAAAEFTWRATCTWQRGTHSRSTVDGFAGLGTEQHHRTTYTFDLDHPECFASEDHGATPAEYVLVALAGCLTAGVAAVAQHRGIRSLGFVMVIGLGMTVAACYTMLPALLRLRTRVEPPSTGLPRRPVRVPSQAHPAQV